MSRTDSTVNVRSPSWCGGILSGEAAPTVAASASQFLTGRSATGVSCPDLSGYGPGLPRVTRRHRGRNLGALDSVPPRSTSVHLRGFGRRAKRRPETMTCNVGLPLVC